MQCESFNFHHSIAGSSTFWYVTQPEWVDFSTACCQLKIRFKYKIEDLILEMLHYKVRQRQ